MAEQTPPVAAAPTPQTDVTPHVTAAAIPAAAPLQPDGFSVDNMPPPGVPMEVHIDRTHPDLAGLRTRNDVSYVYEFYNEETNSGPHLARTSLWRGADFKDDRAKFLLSHPHIRIDWGTVKAFPNVFAAHAFMEERRKQLYLKDPARMGAEEMYPGEPNRILEAGKPE
jgi:hypothetical protein